MNNLSNKEQADLVKAFWNDYGRWISIAILIGLLVGFGWRWHNNHEQKQQMKECFELMDQDGSGAIDAEELGAAFKLLGRCGALICSYQQCI